MDSKSSRTTSQSILIIQTAYLGDLLLGLPFFRLLHGPDVRLTLMCRAGIGEFMKKTGFFYQVLEVDKSKDMSTAWSEVRRTHWDVVYSIHESPRTNLNVWRLKASFKVGFRNWYNKIIFDERISRPMELPEPLRQLSLLKSHPTHGRLVKVTLDEFEKRQSRRGGQAEHESYVTHLTEIPVGMELSLPNLRKTQLERQRHRKKPLRVAVAPGSAWATKRWSTEGFISFMERMTSEWQEPIDWQVVGAPNERELCRQIVDAVHTRFPHINAALAESQLDLWEVAELYAQADLVIANDSGAQHLAALSGVPTVSVFGPTTLDFGYRPWNQSAVVVERRDLDCRPCSLHGGESCPLGTHECMQKLPPAAVTAAAKQLLHRTTS